MPKKLWRSLGLDLDFKPESFKVEFTEQYVEEMIEIYKYITINLKRNIAAKRLFVKINNRLSYLAENPYIYSRVEKIDKLKREYHKMVIGNYIVIYTVDKNNRIVYISHIIYGRKEFFN